MNYSRSQILILASALNQPVVVIVAHLRELGATVALNSGIVDTSLRGSGNRAWRRMGNDIYRGCDCVICVEYGGDCSNVMRQEWISEAHRERRGVKTKLSKREHWCQNRSCLMLNI